MKLVSKYMRITFFRYDAVSLGNCFPTFRSNIVPSSSRVKMSDKNPHLFSQAIWRSGRSQWQRGLKAWICGHPPAEIVGSNPIGGMENLSVVNILCCQVDVLRRADHSSREVLPTVVRRCV